jgi:hypothetical protein
MPKAPPRPPTAHPRPIAAAIGLAFAASLTPMAIAQCEPQRFWPDFEPRSLEFGVDVAISDEHLIVVDRYGWVYTYRRGNGGVWVFNHTVPGSSGGAVVLDGDRFITGSLGVERYGGAVIYEFDGGSWHEAAQLESPDSTVYASSGYVVALHGDTAAFANWGTRVVLFHEFDGVWTMTEEMRADTSQVGGVGFGNAMAMDDRFLVIGAPIERITGIHNGAVYVYEWDAAGEPVLVQRIEPEPAAVGPRLGSALALDGDTLVVGAWGKETADEQVVGAAYIYTLVDGRWLFQQELTAPEPQDGAYFGGSVDIHDGLIVIGAEGDASGPIGRGVAYLYRQNHAGAWLLAGDVAPDIETFNYAHAVRLGGSQLAIGGRDVFRMGFDQGVADVYDLDCILCPPDLDADGALTIFDFLTFLNLFDAGDAQADFDGDGDHTLFDFLAFQSAFDAGCE